MAREVYFGIAGWSYADWKGIVYPEGKVDELAYISEYVDCIEINNTFYRPPSVRNVESWVRRTEGREGFFFTVKLHRDVTHEGKIEASTVRAFQEGLEPMVEAGRLGMLLAQFRYDFADCGRNREYLGRMVEAFGESFRLAVEVRHVSWEREAALEFLAGLGVTVVNLDYPVGRDSFHMKVCAVGREGYFRLHGRNYATWFSKAGRDETYNYDYGRAELEEVARRVEAVREKVGGCVTVIGNNHYRGGEVVNVLELKAMMTGAKVAAPSGLVRAYPRLRGIVREA